MQCMCSKNDVRKSCIQYSYHLKAHIVRLAMQGQSFFEFVQILEIILSIYTVKYIIEQKFSANPAANDGKDKKCSNNNMGSYNPCGQR